MCVLALGFDFFDGKKSEGVQCRDGRTRHAGKVRYAGCVVYDESRSAHKFIG